LRGLTYRPWLVPPTVLLLALKVKLLSLFIIHSSLESFEKALPDTEQTVNVITEIELLSFPRITEAMKEAVEYLGRLGGPKRAPGDGPPGVKTIWIGLMKLYILLAYREYII
jgi:hypothetical protein